MLYILEVKLCFTVKLVLLYFVKQNKTELDKETTADSIYEEQLEQMINEYLDTNINNNDTKSHHLYDAKKYLLGCIISTLICSIPFTINFIENKNNEVAYIGGTALGMVGQDEVNWVIGAYKTIDEFKKCFEPYDLNRLSDEEILKRYFNKNGK